jgi:hypothetical protein
LARIAHEPDLEAFARRIGIRIAHVSAIEEARFSELPAGIYGRSAVKAYAAASGLDPAETLVDASAFLVSVNDPIVGLARLKGLRPVRSAPPPSESDPAPGAIEPDAARPPWRPLTAALIDALIVTALLLFVVLAAVAVLAVPVSALDRSSPVFGVMGLLLAAGYFLCFGGIGGATVGERVMQVAAPPQRETLTLDAVAARALQAASEDVRCLCELGARLGRRLTVPPPPVFGNDAGMSGR